MRTDKSGATGNQEAQAPSSRLCLAISEKECHGMKLCPTTLEVKVRSTAVLKALQFRIYFTGPHSNRDTGAYLDNISARNWLTASGLHARATRIRAFSA